MQVRLTAVDPTLVVLWRLFRSFDNLLKENVIFKEDVLKSGLLDSFLPKLSEFYKKWISLPPERRQYAIDCEYNGNSILD